MNGAWRFSRLLSAPHRLGFFAGAMVFSASAVWWFVVLAARSAGLDVGWAVAPPQAHGLLMSLGFMPLFITGFAFTAGPRWLGAPDVDARMLLRPVAAMLAGWALALVGFHASAAWAALGLALVAAGWGRLAWRFIAMLRSSRARDRTHATLVATSMVVGVLALGLAAAGLATARDVLQRAAALLALWAFVAPVFAVVSHRMIPFFTASTLPFLDAWRPMWLLWTMLGALWFEAGLALAELAWGPLSPVLRGLQAALEAPVAVLLLWLALRWGLVQSLRIRLLAMLHGGFLWLGIALALAALSHALMALTEGEISLGLAPLHALTMGYLGATMFAMITRVSAGHSGRPLAADDLAFGLYGVLQAAVLLRVIGAIATLAGTALLLLAAGLWALAAAGWALRYGSWFGRPRIDGRPG